MNAVEIREVSKAYGRTTVLDEVCLSVPGESITAILGPSGSGKTTLLRLIAGFDRPDHGSIAVAGKTVADRQTHVRPERRGVGYVPQDGALFPHLTARRNIGFGLHRGERDTVEHLLELIGLDRLGHRYPHELSGGQQQRVALARALAIKPPLVLLDEPFSSLDAGLRATLRGDVVRILTETKTPAIIVTHDQDEALSVADHVAILDAGRVLAEGHPTGLYAAPPSVAVARQLGAANLLAATIVAGSAQCALGSLRLHEGVTAADGPATVLVRPEQLRLAADGHGLGAHVDAIDYHGHDLLAHLRLPDSTALMIRISGDDRLQVGDGVHVQPPDAVLAWPAR